MRGRIDSTGLEVNLFEDVCLRLKNSAWYIRPLNICGINVEGAYTRIREMRCQDDSQDSRWHILDEW